MHIRIAYVAKYTYVCAPMCNCATNTYGANGFVEFAIGHDLEVQIGLLVVVLHALQQQLITIQNHNNVKCCFSAVCK